MILLALSVCINYIDRTTLSVAAPRLGAELGIDPEQKAFCSPLFFIPTRCARFRWLAGRSL